MSTEKKKNITAQHLFKRQPPLSFGMVLRSWRLAEEMSQTELAAFLGLSRANLCDIEKERKIPSPGRALKIARKLGMFEAQVIELILQDTLRKEKIKFKVSVAA